jgi:Xaa-Pro dipeptidase
VNVAVEKIRDWMKQARYDVILLKSRANFAWVTGGSDNHIVNVSGLGIADLAIFPDRILCVTSKVEHRRLVEEELAGLDVEMVVSDWFTSPYEPLFSTLEGKRIGVDIADPMGDCVAEQLSRLRRQWTERQLDQFREVSHIAAEAIEHTAKHIQPGQSEFEIAAALSAAVIRHGCTPVVTLVGTDERIFKFRHPIPTGKRLRQYAMLVLGCEKNGLIASVTRFVHFGPVSDDLAMQIRNCAWIDAQMMANTKPGSLVSDVLKAALHAYTEVGHPDDYQFLHQGGPAGYATREYFATTHSHDVIEAGQVYAWNPSLVGIKSEDTVLVTDTGVKVLTHTGKWPYLAIEYGGQVYERPDVLRRES